MTKAVDAMVLSMESLPPSYEENNGSREYEIKCREKYSNSETECLFGYELFTFAFTLLRVSAIYFFFLSCAVIIDFGTKLITHLSNLSAL